VLYPFDLVCHAHAGKREMTTFVVEAEGDAAGLKLNIQSLKLNELTSEKVVSASDLSSRRAS
jgi:hypothetical protein